MAEDSLMRQAQEFIVSQLERNPEFSQVEIGYNKFSSQFLNDDKKRNIRAVRTDGAGAIFSYLIVVNSSTFREAPYALAKLQEADKQGLKLMHVHCKGNDSDFFKWAGSTSRSRVSRKSIPIGERRRHIETTKQERYLSDRLGRLVYFNPDTTTLEVVEFLQPSNPDYSSSSNPAVSRIGREYEYKTIRDHRVVAAYPTFGLGNKQRNKLTFAEPVCLTSIESKIGSLFALESAARENGQENPSASHTEEQIIALLDGYNSRTLTDLSRIFGERKIEEYVPDLKQRISPALNEEAVELGFGCSCIYQA